MLRQAHVLQGRVPLKIEQLTKDGSAGLVSLKVITENKGEGEME